MQPGKSSRTTGQLSGSIFPAALVVRLDFPGCISSPMEKRVRPVVRLDFPGCISSPMEKRVPTTQVGGWDTSSDSDAGHIAVEESDRGDSAVEGSEEHCEDGSGEEVDESEGEGGRGPEGSDFAAEEGYEEGDLNAEEGHEEVWDEVQEALSTMGREDYDEAVLCARSQAS